MYNGGRPVPGYSFDQTQHPVSDEQIKEGLMELIAGDGAHYGYRKLTVCLRRQYGLIVNKKKVYRLCRELDILKPERRKRLHFPRRLANNREIRGSNQLWEMDVKYGYIAAEQRFFFLLNLIDVYDRSIIDYHMGKTYPVSIQRGLFDCLRGISTQIALFPLFWSIIESAHMPVNPNY